MNDEFDVIVLGAGSTGENVADRAVRGGLTAVVVEHELVGGECSYWACIPSKLLLRPGQAFRAARRVPGASAAVKGGLDVAAVLSRRNYFTGNWTDTGQVRWLDSVGITLARGHGRLTGEREVTVTGPGGAPRVLRARHAVAICTGSEPTLPAIEGLAEASPWTSREATSARRIPQSLAIIGGGAVGAEMATAYASLGARVTLLARSGLLARMEPFVGASIVAGLTGAGVDVRLDAEVTRVERTHAGVTVETASGDVVSAAELLVATGRSARTTGLGLEALDPHTGGVVPGGFLDVDDTLRVPGSTWLYGVGDVNGRALLTHQGKYQARAAGDAIVARANGQALDDSDWGRHVATADHGAVPQVIFTDPEIATVGLTEAAARAAGYEVRAVDYSLANVAGAMLREKGYRGRARILVDTKREVLLGATFIGPDVADLLQSATIAIVGEVPLARLWHAVPAYPTVSEVWLRLLEVYERDSAE